jgi:transcriptional regulator with XRE-family HTH domain
MDKKAFGKQIQKYRNRSGYSQEKLAELMGCSAIFISYIERGEKMPGFDNLIKLANILGVSVDILLGGELKEYSIAKLKDIEKKLKEFPIKEQRKMLEVIDAVITVEKEYLEKKMK